MSRGPDREPHPIVQLVHDLGMAGREATATEVAERRAALAEQVLPTATDLALATRAGNYLLAKHALHAADERQWAEGTSPTELLRRLRATVENRAGGIRLYRDPNLAAWMVLSVARSGRWRGPEG